MMTSVRMKLMGASVLAVAAGLAGCERPPIDVVQRGFRGTGMEQPINPRLLEEQVAATELPAVVPPVPAVGPRAADIYENVQVLGDLSVGEFNRLMVAIVNWVSPEDGCNYCHNAEGFAHDDLYTKKVARVMLAMTQRVNGEWGASGKHSAPSGVTCYTCHRGKNVPEYVWVNEPAPRLPGSLARFPQMQNLADADVGYTSLPYDPFSLYLEKDTEIRMAGDTALPTGNTQTIKDTEKTYALMMHISGSLGVNCTYCHNSRAFARWEESPPTRLTAWHGIRMVRELNTEYIAATTDWLPGQRKGPLGDAPKVACNTCHQGAYKPLYGYPMLADYPNLGKESAGAKALLSAAHPALSAPSVEAGAAGGDD